MYQTCWNILYKASRWRLVCAFMKQEGKMANMENSIEAPQELLDLRRPQWINQDTSVVQTKSQYSALVINSQYRRHKVLYNKIHLLYTVLIEYE